MSGRPTVDWDAAFRDMLENEMVSTRIEDREGALILSIRVPGKIRQNALRAAIGSYLMCGHKADRETGDIQEKRALHEHLKMMLLLDVLIFHQTTHKSGR